MPLSALESLYRAPEGHENSQWEYHRNAVAICLWVCQYEVVVGEFFSHFHIGKSRSAEPCMLLRLCAQSVQLLPDTVFTWHTAARQLLSGGWRISIIFHNSRSHIDFFCKMLKCSLGIDFLISSLPLLLLLFLFFFCRLICHIAADSLSAWRVSQCHISAACEQCFPCFSWSLEALPGSAMYGERGEKKKKKSTEGARGSDF